jgi:3-methyladenine DNA glycosylase AlkD
METDALVALATQRLSEAADPEKAGPMAAYLKTDMPFYGVQKAGRVPIQREIRKRFPPADPEEYRKSVLALWNLPHREEKYLAIGYARSFPAYIAPASMALYRQLIVEGAWWDLVDGIASDLVGTVLLDARPETTPTIEAWIDDPDLWLRRTAIICQLRHNERTDVGLLFRACEARMAETEFFIRKAIGWALRQYARTDPEAVRRFVIDHRDRMSGLSYREATKHLEVE